MSFDDIRQDLLDRLTRSGAGVQPGDRAGTLLLLRLHGQVLDPPATLAFSDDELRTYLEGLRGSALAAMGGDDLERSTWGLFFVHLFETVETRRPRHDRVVLAGGRPIAVTSDADICRALTSDEAWEKIGARAAASVESAAAGAGSDLRVEDVGSTVRAWRGQPLAVPVELCLTPFLLAQHLHDMQVLGLVRDADGEPVLGAVPDFLAALDAALTALPEGAVRLATFEGRLDQP